MWFFFLGGEYPTESPKIISRTFFLLEILTRATTSEVQWGEKNVLSTVTRTIRQKLLNAFSGELGLIISACHTCGQDSRGPDCPRPFVCSSTWHHTITVIANDVLWPLFFSKRATRATAAGRRILNTGACNDTNRGFLKPTKELTSTWMMLLLCLRKK